MGFCSGGVGSNTAEIDVEDGKIVRIRPPHYDKHYTPEEMNAWTYNVDGKEFKASLKGELPPHSIAYMDWIKIGFDSSGVNEKISFEEFIDKQ